VLCKISFLFLNTYLLLVYFLTLESGPRVELITQTNQTKKAHATVPLKRNMVIDHYNLKVPEKNISEVSILNKAIPTIPQKVDYASTALEELQNLSYFIKHLALEHSTYDNSNLVLSVNLNFNVQLNLENSETNLTSVSTNVLNLFPETIKVEIAPQNYPACLLPMNNENISEEITVISSPKIYESSTTETYSLQPSTENNMNLLKETVVVIPESFTEKSQLLTPATFQSQPEVQKITERPPSLSQNVITFQNVTANSATEAAVIEYLIEKSNNKPLSTTEISSKLESGANENSIKTLSKLLFSTTVLLIGIPMF